MSEACEVVIIGGGLAGLAAAAALAKEGLGVTVLDSSDKTPQDKTPQDYYGNTLWPGADRALQWLGLSEEVAAAGCRLRSMHWHDGRADEMLALQLSSNGPAGSFVGVRPSLLHSALEAAAKRGGATIVGGVRHWEMSRAPGCVTVRTDGPSPLQLRARLLLGCDGAGSRVRKLLGLRALRWRPPRQLILTGVGARVERHEFNQVMGGGWARGCVALGDGGSWLYGVLGEPPGGDGALSLRSLVHGDPWADGAGETLESVAIFRPSSVRVRRWARDRVLLVGDAAHGMLPHIGLGGSVTLEGIPTLHEVVMDALGRDDLSADRLEEMRRRRSSRVAYARRISELWALATTAALPGVERLRDASMRSVAKQPGLLQEFVDTFASGQTPSLRTRLRVRLP